MPVAVKGRITPPCIEIKRRKSYLVESLPSTPDGQEVLMEWAEFLLGKVGKESIEKIVESYVKMGWISPDVSEALLSYVDVLKVDEPDISVPELSPEDHRKSFSFVKRLAGLT